MAEHLGDDGRELSAACSVWHFVSPCNDHRMGGVALLFIIWHECNTCNRIYGNFLGNLRAGFALNRAMKANALALLFLMAVGPQCVAQSKPGVTVYGTKTGHKYHRDGCSYLRESRIEMTLTQAKNRRLEPCSKCKPPR